MARKKKIVVLSGAGISAESGIKTFRDSDGLWEEYNVMDVASIDGWHKNPDLMQQFYNERRKQLEHAQPNTAHKILAELERDFDVEIITQNVDNLHERAGSTKITHLHGELTKVRSVKNPNVVFDIAYREIALDEKAEDGGKLRPHIVWFGEAVPMMETAATIVSGADIVIIIGTSLNVYPAAGLVDYAPRNAAIYLIDPADVRYGGSRSITFIKEKASTGMETVKKYLY
jgi:NAD-dependent deacetylase